MSNSQAPGVKFNCFSLFLLFFIFSFECLAQTSSNCNPSINITPNPASLCSPQTASFVATSFNAGNNPIYQWKKNGVVVGNNSPLYSGSLSVNDDVFCELTTTDCGNNTIVASNHFIFETFDNVTPEVTTVASQQIICAGTTVTFTATNKSGNTNVSYQWLVNGNPIAGTNMTVFSTNTLTDSSVVICMMTVPTCLSGGGSTKDYSDPIVIRVSPLLNPSVYIATATPVACNGSPVSFTATTLQAGNNPTFEWMVNGAVVFTGPVFTSSALADGDTINCKLIVDPSSNCGLQSSAISNIIVMKVKDFLTPSISIIPSKTEICSGTPVVFTANVTDGGLNPSYQWELNNLNTGINSPVYTNSLLNDGDIINCKLTTSSGCNIATATSNSINMMVNKSPVISFDLDSLTIWAGEQTPLHARISGDVVSFMWIPANKLIDPTTLSPLTIPLVNNTSYKLTAVSSKGCSASKELFITVFHSLYMPNSFTPNMDGINDVFRIPPGVPIELKEFSIFDRWGNLVFSTKDVNLGWNGRYKGILSNAGVYVYFIKGKYQNQEILKKGHALLIR